MVRFFAPFASKDDKLVVAAKRGDFRNVRTLLARGANANFKDKHHESPLFHASKYGYVSIVQELLAQGADVMLPDK
ncbi:unnamed protein product, partial [Aphanomyces euteiches]